MADKSRKQVDEVLLLTLACGATVEQAARQCGLSVRTVYRRLANMEFRRRVQTFRGDIFARTAGTLTAAGAEASRTLVELARNHASGSVRLGAARAVLEIGMKARETADLEERVVALEQRFGTNCS